MYNRLYGRFGMEREGLFRLLRETISGSSVLYPACHVHVTPSFYFSYVIYIDWSADSRRFFADEEGVRGLIEDRKTYNRECSWRFLAADYRAPNDIPPASVDLLISLYGGTIIPSCEKYVAPGGFIITNNHEGEADAAVGTGRFVKAGTIQYRDGRYAYDPENPEDRGQRRRGASGPSDRSLPSGLSAGQYTADRRSGLHVSGSEASFLDKDVYSLLCRRRAVP